MAAKAESWQEVARAKREAIADSIPKPWRIDGIPSATEQRDVTGDYIRQWLSRDEIEITEMDAVDIVEKTCSGIWTAEEVARAFCHRASVAHQLVSCFLETFFDAAIEDAKMLDEYFAKHKEPIGPLHGLPVSLKDQFHVKGVETSMGYVGWIGTFQGQKGTGREKVFESEMVKELRSLGAVLFCKTSVPHALMSGESVNNIIGYTWNPKNRNLSAGGSSGGEGALIGLKGSPVGFGTDIGGSIRIPAGELPPNVCHPCRISIEVEAYPWRVFAWSQKRVGVSSAKFGEPLMAPDKKRARVSRVVTLSVGSLLTLRSPIAFNGLYGLRCSSGRLPYEGMANSMDGQNTVLSVVGPLSHSVASLRLLVQALLSQNPWLHDPLVHEIPWRPEHEQQIANLIKESRSGSAKLAFGVMKHDGQVTPHPPVRRAMDIIQETLSRLDYETVEWKPPSHRRSSDIVLKSWLYDGGEDIHSSLGLSGEPIVPQVGAAYGEKAFPAASAKEIAATNVTKREFQKEYMEYWNSTKDLTKTGRPVDALIMPLAPFAAARPEKYIYYGYSTIINVLDYTSCTMPVTLASKATDTAIRDFKPVSDLDRKIMESYDPDVYDGAHVAVQIVGRRLQEEKVLALAELIGKAVKESERASPSL